MPASKQLIYLDHAATTPLDTRVFEVMLPFLKDHYGNASSVHRMGRKSRFAIEDSRERIAGAIGASPGEIVFTSGGTEGNNLAIKGALNGKKLLTSPVEHEAVLTQALTLSGHDGRTCWAKMAPDGSVDVEKLDHAMNDQIGVVSLMYVNNEIGVVNPIDKIGAVAEKNKVLFHCDAVQAVGLYSLDMSAQPIDMLTCSAHKFYGPKGIGFMFVRSGVELQGVIEGGAQERRRRGGTEHVAGIVGMAKALELAVAERNERRRLLEMLKEQLVEGISSILTPGTYAFNSPLDPASGSPHIVNIAFYPQDGVPLDGEMLILNFDMEHICVSSGSACTSGAIEPSHVLSAMGLDEDVASAAIRFSLGKDNTPAEIERTLECLERVVSRMRGTVHA